MLVGLCFCVSVLCVCACVCVTVCDDPINFTMEK